MNRVVAVGAVLVVWLAGMPAEAQEPTHGATSTIDAQPVPGLVPVECERCFDFELKPKFGLDRNNNGIVDLPMSTEYIQEPLTATFYFDDRGQILPISDAPSLRQRYLWILQPIIQFPSPEVSVVVPGRPAVERYLPGSLPIGHAHYETSCIPETTFYDVPEGHYRLQVQLIEVDSTGCRISISAENMPEFVELTGRVSHNVRLEDIVFFAFGDSYSSGEGNPEQICVDPVAVGCAQRNVVWGDDGVVDAWPRWREDGTALVTFENLEHHLSHRSTLAWPAQAALLLELSDPRTSVTFMSFAQSGGTIAVGGLGPYSGVNVPAFGPYTMAPQVTQAQRLAAGRPIDVVTMTFGGNDAGFANVITSLLARDGIFGSEPNLAEIKESFHNGDWTTVENTALLGAEGYNTVAELITEFKGGWNNYFPRHLPGLNGLPGEFEKLANVLDAFPGSPNVYILPYPNPTRRPVSANPDAWWSNGFETCGEVLTSVADGALSRQLDLEISTQEQAWAESNIVGPLNAVIRGSAAAHGWTFVGDVDSVFLGHGTCEPIPSPPELFRGNQFDPRDGIPGPVTPRPGAPMTWLRRAHESSVIQGPSEVKNTKGTMHPNHYGHAAMAARLIAHLDPPGGMTDSGRRTWEYDQLTSRRTFSEAPVVNPIEDARHDRLSLGTDRNMYRLALCTAQAVRVDIDARQIPAGTRPLQNAYVRAFRVENLASDSAPSWIAAGLPPGATGDETWNVQTADRVAGKLAARDVLEHVTIAWSEIAAASVALTVVAPSAGTYVVGVSGGPRPEWNLAGGNFDYDPLSYGPDSTGDFGAYHVSFRTQAGPDDFIGAASALVPEQWTDGQCLDRADDVDMYVVPWKADHALLIEATGQPLFLRILDAANGAEVANATFSDGWGDLAPGLSVEAGALRIGPSLLPPPDPCPARNGQCRGDYRIAISPGGPIDGPLDYGLRVRHAPTTPPSTETTTAGATPTTSWTYTTLPSNTLTPSDEFERQAAWGMLDLAEGDWWRFAWREWDESAGDHHFAEGEFSVRLGAPTNVDGLTMYALLLSGDTGSRRLWAPPGALLGADAEGLWTSMDGATREFLIGGGRFSPTPLGYFQRAVPGHSYVASEGSMQNDYYAAQGTRFTVAADRGHCVSHGALPRELCRNTGTEVSVQEHILAGVGPVGFVAAWAVYPWGELCTAQSDGTQSCSEQRTGPAEEQGVRQVALMASNRLAGTDFAWSMPKWSVEGDFLWSGGGVSMAVAGATRIAVKQDDVNFRWAVQEGQGWVDRGTLEGSGPGAVIALGDDVWFMDDSGTPRLYDGGSWNDGEPLPAALEDVRAVALSDGGKPLALVVGVPAGETALDAWLFDPGSQTWDGPWRADTAARTNYCLAGADATAYVISGTRIGTSEGPRGGVPFETPDASVLRFDLGSRAWAPAPALPQPVQGPACAHPNGAVYVVGGVAAQGTLRDVHALRDGDSAWTQVSPIPVPLAHSVAIDAGAGLEIWAGMEGPWSSRRGWTFDPDRGGPGPPAADEPRA